MDRFLSLVGTALVDLTEGPGSSHTGLGSRGRSLAAEAGTVAGCRDGKLAGGYWHSCAILQSADLKCWGNGAHGQLGYDSTDTKGERTGEMTSLGVVNLGVGRTAVIVAAGKGVNDSFTRAPFSTRPT